jgi:superkiller protein 3
MSDKSEQHLELARFALTKYIERDGNDPNAWTLFGLVQEHLTRITESCTSFERAFKLLRERGNTQGKELNAVIAHLVRAYCCSGRYQESLDKYGLLAEADKSAHTIFVAAIANYFVGQQQRSLSCFEESLAKATPQERKDYIIVLSQALYALDTDQHRTLATQQLLGW